VRRQPSTHFTHFAHRQSTINNGERRYLWRVTKKKKWRDAGWAMMEAFNRCCKVESGGYVGLRGSSNLLPASSRARCARIDIDGGATLRAAVHVCMRPCVVLIRATCDRCDQSKFAEGRHAAIVLAGRDSQVSVPALFTGRGRTAGQICVQHGGAPVADLARLEKTLVVSLARFAEYNMAGLSIASNEGRK
jgi:hypothetical protein